MRNRRNGRIICLPTDTEPKEKKMTTLSAATLALKTAMINAKSTYTFLGTREARAAYRAAEAAYFAAAKRELGLLSQAKPSPSPGAMVRGTEPR